jgi:hypothetical protein
MIIPDLDEKLSNELKHFYNRLFNIFTSEKIKLIKGSLFITLIKMPPNRISKLLSDSALSNRAFYDADIRELMRDGYICESNDIEKKHEYIITALGIWTIETQMKKVDIAQLIGFFQDTKFSSGVSEKRLTDIEKIILTSMIAMRNFSLETAMDLNDKSKSDYWIEIFNDTAEYLKSRGCIGKSAWMPSRAGNEHPINNVMRRAQDLPQKTKLIYIAARNNRYHLDMVATGEEPRIKLKFLFLIIIGKVESKADIKNTHSFLCKSAYDKGKNVREGFEYIDPEWDSIIEDALDDFYYDQ